MARGRQHNENAEFNGDAGNGEEVQNDEIDHSVTVISKSRTCNWAKVAIFFIFLSTTFIVIFVLFPTGRLVEWFIQDNPKGNLTNSTNTTNLTRNLNEIHLWFEIKRSEGYKRTQGEQLPKLEESLQTYDLGLFTDTWSWIAPESLLIWIDFGWMRILKWNFTVNTARSGRNHAIYETCSHEIYISSLL